ncbi:hypothetical protein FB45DRAFT_415938 [Roridomyces roridus]|uniref:Uncharacterized protein n=1 Tax=Roridomyces roridus TaxID=1738132 RepID=A0AAD7BH16_9AGAR|nr:hypothetical protein FB45DRAFT_150481 [Roridomyces roridus]KAJ7638896.1 hypothetical protein FB45DRAFT_415938 [Roridomyces roridus]
MTRSAVRACAMAPIFHLLHPTIHCSPPVTPLDAQLAAASPIPSQRVYSGRRSKHSAYPTKLSSICVTAAALAPAFVHERVPVWIRLRRAVLELTFHEPWLSLCGT